MKGWTFSAHYTVSIITLFSFELSSLQCIAHIISTLVFFGSLQLTTIITSSVQYAFSSHFLKIFPSDWPHFVFDKRSFLKDSSAVYCLLPSLQKIQEALLIWSWCYNLSMEHVAGLCARSSLELELSIEEWLLCKQWIFPAGESAQCKKAEPTIL